MADESDVAESTRDALLAACGERERLEEVLLAAGCAAGAALCLAGGLAALLGQALGVPAAGTGGLRPYWSVILAALCAWVGGYGWVVYERQGWSPTLRAVEGAAAFGMGALGVALSGGYVLEPGTPLWALFATTLPACEAVFAWGLAAYLARPLWSGNVKARAKAGASVDALPEASSEKLAAWQGVYLFARDRLLVLPVAVAAVWAAAAFAARSDPAPGLAHLLASGALPGGVAVAGCGLALLARVHQRLIALELERAGVRLQPGLGRGAGGRSLGLSLAAALLALVLPANLSPLRAWQFNTWMERFTERFGPMLVPSQAPTRKVGEGLGMISIDRFLSALAGQGGAGAGSGGPLLLWLALLALILFAAWRVFHSGRHTARPVRMGRLPLGLAWLYEQIRDAIRRWLVRWGWVRRDSVSGQASEGAGARLLLRRKARRTGGSSVTAIYVDVLGRLRGRGLGRRESETPLEYLERWRSGPGSGDAGLARLTDLYIAERYAGRQPSAEAVAEARRSGARALRSLARVHLGDVIKLWVRR